MPLARVFSIILFVNAGSSVAFISLLVLFFLPFFFLNCIIFKLTSHRVFPKFLYHCIKLFIYFTNSFEIMARLLISPSFHLIVGNSFLLYVF